MGAVDAAALGPFKESPLGHGREEEKIFSILVAVQFRENHYKCCHQMSYFKAKMHKI